MKQGHLQLHQELSTPGNLTWGVSKDGTSTTSPGNLCQWHTALIVKHFFIFKSPLQIFMDCPKESKIGNHFPNKYCSCSWTENRAYVGKASKWQAHLHPPFAQHKGVHAQKARYEPHVREQPWVFGVLVALTYMPSRGIRIRVPHA